jgi:DNA-binding CsgD family transcriptional regulator
MIDKELAIKLKESGLTNKEIAQNLGCSEGWCRKYLRGVKRKDISQEDFEILQHKGRSPECITTGEVYSKLLIKGNSPEDKKQRKLALRRTKEKLKEDEEVIIRQAWIHPERARFSYNNMLLYINDLNERLDEYVRMHLVECGFTKEQIKDNHLYNSTLSFMVKNSQYGNLVGSYQQGVFESIQASLDSIEERNAQTHYELPSNPKIFIEESIVPY